MPRTGHRKLFDLLVWCALVAAAAIVSTLLRVDLIVSAFLYYGLPALYLYTRHPKHTGKLLLSSGVLGVLFGMAWNILAETTGAYRTHYNTAFFNTPIIGATPFGDFIYGFLIMVGAIMFYTRFADHERTTLSKYWVFALGVGLTTFCLVASLLANAPDTLSARHAYLVLGLFILVPLFTLFWKPNMVRKILYTATFFFGLNLLFELTALHLHHWYFPGTYIGWVSALGLTFPIEELLFWILCGVPSLIICYEFLFDDGR